MIKNYLELSKTEKEKVIQFINRDMVNKLSFEEIDKQMMSEDFGSGKGVIIKVDKGEIIGKVVVILKECSQKGKAYVINLDVREELDNKDEIVIDIIDEAKKTAKKYGAVDIFLGVSNTSIIKILNSLNWEKRYSAIKMTLEDRKIRYSPLDIIPLSYENKREYLNIYNDSFSEVPNGATLTEKEVDEYIKKADESNFYYIAVIDNEMVGFLQFYIEDGVGEFDLGLIKATRGKGYGKRLLETAINFLNKKEVMEIRLSVVTNNTLAYDMYKRRGFKQNKLISDWFELK